MEDACSLLKAWRLQNFSDLLIVVLGKGFLRYKVGHGLEFQGIKSYYGHHGSAVKERCYEV